VGASDRLPVYLIHWRAIDWCASAARAVLESTDVSPTVIVIDNEQSGGDALRSLLPGEVDVLSPVENLGYTGGANLALDHWLQRRPESPFAVVASHDLQLEPHTLRGMLDVAGRDPHIGIVGPGLTAPVSSSGGVFRPTTWAPTDRYELPLADDLPEVVDRSYVSGTCMLLRRACVEQVGRFDESFGSYTEDVDYGLRARDAGWRVVVATKERAAGRGSTDSRQSTWLVPMNSLRLARKRDGVTGLARAAVPHAVDLGRSAVGSLALWRPRPRRDASRQAVYKRAALLKTAARLIRGHDRQLPRVTIPGSGGTTVRGRG
jgi:N-acetylglucosaminyl-diphospho-decaprenol L-rhamnosyltransferase